MQRIAAEELHTYTTHNNCFHAVIYSAQDLKLKWYWYDQFQKKKIPRL